jgi:NSS family neurotransmitter:Na+ symporter
LVFSQGQSPAEGPALVFVVLPGIFNSMGPIFGRIIGGGFFLLLCFAALTSTISLLEVPVAYFVDQKKWSRKTTTWLLAGVIFILGLPSMLSQGAVKMFSSLPFYQGRSALDFVSEVFSDISLPLGGCLMTIFIVRRWGTQNMSEELYQGNETYKNSFLEKYINFSIRYICPVILGIFSILIIIDKFYGIDKLMN